jgi:hypothetical protein
MSSKKGTVVIYTHLDRVDQNIEKLAEWSANVTINMLFGRFTS